MRDGAHAPRAGGGCFSARSLSNYMRIVSSGASTAASTLRSAGASLVNSIASHEEDGSRDQIHCFDAATMEREYTVLTSPTVAQISGYGPLGLGPRWIAYSGIPVLVPVTGRVSPQLLSLSPFVPPPGSNGSVVAYYAKESSKQLAAGIVTLGDVGYKKLSKYCADFIPNGNGIVKQRSFGYKANGATNGHLIDSEYAGTVHTSSQ